MAADPRSKKHAVHRSRSCPTSGSSCGRSLTDQHIETPKHQRFTSERRLHAARNEDSAAGRRPRDSGDVARNLHHPTPPAIAAQILRATESSLDRRPYHSNPAKMYELPASSFHRIPTDNDRACKKKYILLVCSALMMSGAPTHRLEHYMQSSAVAVGIGLDSFYIPGCIVLSFSASPNQPSEVHIVRRVEALNLSKLHEVHSIYKAVIHGRITTGKAICQLDDISSSRTNRYPLWLQVILYGLTSACFGPISYGARPVDVPIIFLFGTLVGFLQLVLAPKSELYGYVFEMTAAILVSCLGRAFGSISWDSDARFCFSAISQASIVLLLPGFTIICSALELQSKNIVSGAVRMVYGIIYTLFLAFGFTIGTTIYAAMDHSATSARTCNEQLPFWWQIMFVPLFTICFVFLNHGDLKTTPRMIFITTAGWLINYFSAQRFPSNVLIPQALGAVTVGLLANLHSRLCHGLAIAIMHPAIYIQVPGSFAASGSFVSGLTTADQINKPNLTNGESGNTAELIARSTSPMLDAGLSMVEIAVSITVGLSMSALLVYPLRKKVKSGIFSL